MSKFFFKKIVVDLNCQLWAKLDLEMCEWEKNKLRVKIGLKLREVSPLITCHIAHYLYLIIISNYWNVKKLGVK